MHHLKQLDRKIPHKETLVHDVAKHDKPIIEHAIEHEMATARFYEALANAEDELQNVLFLRNGSINMLDMVEVYHLEDDAIYKLNIALAELYNYLIQPFLDMREIAFSKLRDARAGLQNPNYGQRRKAEFAIMLEEWQENYVHALDRIQEFYIEYYTKTVGIYKGM